MPKPSFICIGPHKTGTTWLHQNLDFHKEASTTFMKEIHHFVFLEKIKKDSYYKKFFSKEFFYSFKRRLLLHAPINAISDPSKYLFKKDNRKIFQKYLKIIFKNQKYFWKLWNKELYEELFFTQNNEIVGDICPAYADLKVSTIEKIKRDYPNVKIIIFLREPEERLLSEIKMNIRLNTLKNDSAAIRNWINSSINDDRLYPYKMLSKWKSVFNNEQISVGFYDDLVKSPVSFFRNICKFLGINTDLKNNFGMRFCSNSFRIVAKDIEFDYEKILMEKINKGKSIKLDFDPKYLYQIFHNDVENLSKVVNSPYPKIWLKKYESRII